MKFFSAHYSDRDPAYFSAESWRSAVEFAEPQGQLITLYWLADDAGDAPVTQLVTEGTN